MQDAEQQPTINDGDAEAEARQEGMSAEIDAKRKEALTQKAGETLVQMSDGSLAPQELVERERKAGRDIH